MKPSLRWFVAGSCTGLNVPFTTTTSWDLEPLKYASWTGRTSEPCSTTRTPPLRVASPCIRAKGQYLSNSDSTCFAKNTDFFYQLKIFYSRSWVTLAVSIIHFFHNLLLTRHQVKFIYQRKMWIFMFLFFLGFYIGLTGLFSRSLVAPGWTGLTFKRW